MIAIEEYNKLLAQRVIKNFEKRRMEGFFVKTKEDAVDKVLELIPDESIVSWGGSETMTQMNLINKLKERNYKLLDRSEYTNDKRREFYSKVFLSDYYIMSSNGITEDGELVNIDGVGNRVASLIIGPENVIVIASISKIEKDLDSAIYRAKNVAAPRNTIRLKRNTSCTIKGYCQSCNNDETICANIVVTRHSMEKNRIKIILVEEELGY